MMAYPWKVSDLKIDDVGFLQARGLKKHLKRLNAPSHWMLDKLGGAFVSTKFIFTRPPADQFATFPVKNHGRILSLI